MLSFVGQKRCFQVSLEARVCQPSQSGQRSRQELRQRHWTSSWRFQSGFTFTLQMGMIELRNSCMNSIYHIPYIISHISTLLDQRHRGRGLKIFGELPRENEGPATVIRNILALLFLRRNQSNDRTQPYFSNQEKNAVTVTHQGKILLTTLHAFDFLLFFKILMIWLLMYTWLAR